MKIFALCLAAFFLGIILDRLYVVYMLRRVNRHVHRAIEAVERASRDAAAADVEKADQAKRVGRN
ncbi:MAG: hypothetical protein AAB152_07265 [Candidatus Coatesbacteria bacterium]